MVRGAEPGERALIRALAGQGGSLAELARATGADPATVAARLDALAQAGVLVTEDEPPVALAPRLRERFDRQLPYLAEHGDPGAAQLRLRGARVVVLGCGGLGTWAVGALASLGSAGSC